MNLNLQMAASNVSTTADRLTALGLPIPGDVTIALDALEAATNYAEPDTDAMLGRLRNASPDEVRAILEEYADVTARRAAIAEVLPEVIDPLQRRAVAALHESIDKILGSAAKPFAALADEFTEHYRRLPDNVDARLDSLSPDEFVSYAKCRELAPTLDTYHALHQSLVSLPQGPGSTVLEATRFATAPNTLTAERIAQTTNPTFGKAGAVLAQPGTSLTWWPTQAAHREHAATLPKVEIRNVREGIGYVAREVEVA